MLQYIHHCHVNENEVGRISSTHGENEKFQKLYAQENLKNEPAPYVMILKESEMKQLCPY